jgi:hypothetical protein
MDHSPECFKFHSGFPLHAVAYLSLGIELHFRWELSYLRSKLPRNSSVSYPVYFRNSGAMQKHGSFTTADPDGVTGRAER